MHVTSAYTSTVMYPSTAPTVIILRKSLSNMRYNRTLVTPTNKCDISRKTITVTFIIPCKPSAFRIFS